MAANLAQEIRALDSRNNPVLFQASSGESVTPSDSTVLIPGILYIGGTGNLRVQTINGDDITFTGVAGSFILPLMVNKVFSTGTTATSINIMRA